MEPKRLEIKIVEGERLRQDVVVRLLMTQQVDQWQKMMVDMEKFVVEATLQEEYFRE